MANANTGTTNRNFLVTAGRNITAMVAVGALAFGLSGCDDGKGQNETVSPLPTPSQIDTPTKPAPEQTKEPIPNNPEGSFDGVTIPSKLEAYRGEILNDMKKVEDRASTLPGYVNTTFHNVYTREPAAKGAHAQVWVRLTIVQNMGKLGDLSSKCFVNGLVCDTDEGSPLGLIGDNGEYVPMA